MRGSLSSGVQHDVDFSMSNNCSVVGGNFVPCMKLSLSMQGSAEFEEQNFKSVVFNSSGRKNVSVRGKEVKLDGSALQRCQRMEQVRLHQCGHSGRAGSAGKRCVSGRNIGGSCGGIRGALLSSLPMCSELATQGRFIGIGESKEARHMSKHPRCCEGSRAVKSIVPFPSKALLSVQ